MTTFATKSRPVPALPASTVRPFQRTPAVRAILRSPRVQAKLRIGAVDDPAEHEADRVANQVMRMRDPGNEPASLAVATRSDTAPLRRLCAECEDDVRRQPAEEGPRREDEVEEIPVRRQAADEDELVEAKHVPGKAPASSSASAATIQAVRGGGSPLPAAERAFFERRFGRSFDDVRIHTGADADRAARSINARAFTWGHDVAFGAANMVQVRRRAGTCWRTNSPMWFRIQRGKTSATCAGWRGARPGARRAPTSSSFPTTRPIEWMPLSPSSSG
jgi:hypothetical protein